MLYLESQLGHGIVRLFGIGLLVLFVVFVILLIVISNYRVNQDRKKLGDAYVPKVRKPLAPGIIVAIVLTILGVAAVVISI